jgi:hypothetical protein
MPLRPLRTRPVPSIAYLALPSRPFEVILGKYGEVFIADLLDALPHPVSVNQFGLELTISNLQIKLAKFHPGLVA